MDTPRARRIQRAALKQVHVAKHATEAHLIKGFLESNGISAIVRGEFLTSGWGELPTDVCSVWITDDEQYERADRLLVDFLSGRLAREAAGQSWTCGQCGEALEGQFTACWKCGAARPAER
jgi:hypothetical protein